MSMRDISNAIDDQFSQAEVPGGWNFLLSRDVNLIDAGNLAGSRMEQPKRDVFVKLLDRLMPVFLVETGTHQLPLLGVEVRVAAEHEIPPSLAHVQGSSFTPGHIEIFSVFQDIFSAHVRSEVDPRWNPGRLIPRVILGPPKISQDLPILTWNCHGVMDINRVGLEMVGECSQS